jgi:hypothetical protein
VSPAGWLLLLAVVAAIGYVVWRRQRPAARRPITMPGGDDLSTLGLSEVRVRQGRPDGDEGPRSEAAPAGPPRAGARPATAAARPRPPAPADGPRPRPAAPYVRPGSALWPEGGRAAALALASLAEHAGGPAAVLVRDDEADAYTVEARAPAAGRPPEPVPAASCPLRRAPQDRALTRLQADDVDGIHAVVGTTGAVYTRALAAPPAAPAFLVVAAHGAPDADLLDRYADLLAALTALDPESAAGPSAADLPAEAPAARPADEPVVPRAEIIREEQGAAGRVGRPLAFALVTLADAEALLEGDPAALAEAEAALRDRLDAADGVRRVEPFGDLLFGAFLDLDPEGAAGWCDVLASGEPPLFIGAVAPADADPTAVRDAAAEALRDAYVKRRAQVVEAE